jgi:phospholipase/lecithinase/hemolysin
MASQWLRRAWLLAACATGVLLAACGGGGSVSSQFTPERVVAFGDSFGDLGQNGRRYTVNDGAVNNWTQWLAENYGRTLTATAAGGLSYATGNARVTAKPDAAGNSATATVTEQVNAFLAASSPKANDLVIFSGGTADVIVQARAVIDGTQTQEQALAAAAQAGREYGALVRRMVDAGATHVAVVGPYNLGRSPWALALKQESLLQAVSGRFNDQFLVSVVDLGAKVLFIDAALYFNLVTASPPSYDLDNVVTPVCTSVDPGPGIGTGPNQVNSNLCTAATVIAGANASRYLFADRVYPTPHGHQLFGDYARSRLRERW